MRIFRCVLQARSKLEGKCDPDYQQIGQSLPEHSFGELDETFDQSASHLHYSARAFFFLYFAPARS
jgi:hypothetical protein